MRGSCRAGLLAGLLLAATFGPPAPVRADIPSTLRADVVLRYRSASGNAAELQGYLSAERPDRLRLATYFGLVRAFELVACRDSFWIVFPHYGVEVNGRREDVHLVPLDPGRLAQSLFLAPMDSSALSRADSSSDSLGVLTLSGSDSLGSFDLRQDRGGAPLELSRRSPSGEPLLTVSFERYAQVEGGRYPRLIRWDDPTRGQTLEMRFTEARLNRPLQPGRFSRPEDPQSKVLPWDSWEKLLLLQP